MKEDRPLLTATTCHEKMAKRIKISGGTISLDQRAALDLRVGLQSPGSLFLALNSTGSLILRPVLSNFLLHRRASAMITDLNQGHHLIGASIEAGKVCIFGHF